jgi:hypothetical protein
MPVHELHVVFKIPYVYDYMTKLRRTEAEVSLNEVNPNVRDTGQGEAMHTLKLGSGQVYDRTAN